VGRAHRDQRYFGLQKMGRENRRDLLVELMLDGQVD